VDEEGVDAGTRKAAESWVHRREKEGEIGGQLWRGNVNLRNKYLAKERCREPFVRLGWKNPVTGNEQYVTSVEKKL